MCIPLSLPLQLARRGLDVVIMSRSREKLDIVAEEISKLMSTHTHTHTVSASVLCCVQGASTVSVRFVCSQSTSQREERSILTLPRSSKTWTLEFWV